MLHCSLTKLPLHLRNILQPNNLPNLKIFLIISEEAFPVLYCSPDLPPSCPNIPFTPDLPLPGAQSLHIILLVDGDKHLLDAGQIMREILLETPRYERAGGITAGEKVVIASRTVHHAVGGDVEDGAIDGEVDGEGSVSAVVEGEL